MPKALIIGIEEEFKSEYSDLSYESDDMEEGFANETNWADIEQANRDGASHALFQLAGKGFKLSENS